LDHPNFFKYLEYPSASYDELKQALRAVDYHLYKEEEDRGYFKKNVDDADEIPLEAPIETEIPSLTIYQIADVNGLTANEVFKIKLWSLRDRD
jgi:hypothetical protein